MSEDAPQPKAKKSKRKDVREAKLMRGLVDPTITATQAAINAGYAESSAAAIASRKQQEPEFKAKLQALMDRAGLTQEAIARKVAEGAEAKKIQRLVINGEIVEKEDTDFEQRGKYLDRARKIRGDMGEASGEEAKNGTQAIFIALEIAVRDRGLLP